MKGSVRAIAATGATIICGLTAAGAQAQESSAPAIADPVGEAFGTANTAPAGNLEPELTAAQPVDEAAFRAAQKASPTLGDDKPDRVPFSYTVDFDSSLRGRDMTSRTGQFCNTFRATYNQANVNDYIKITLIRNVDNGYDDKLDTKRFLADGAYHSHCWARSDVNAVYHFQYRVQVIGYDIRGNGRAYRPQ
jgi:hypothetical protein